VRDLLFRHPAWVHISCVLLDAGRSKYQREQDCTDLYRLNTLSFVKS